MWLYPKVITGLMCTIRKTSCPLLVCSEYAVLCPCYAAYARNHLFCSSNESSHCLSLMSLANELRGVHSLTEFRAQYVVNVATDQGHKHYIFYGRLQGFSFY